MDGNSESEGGPPPETLTLPLIKGKTTLENALEEEENMLVRLKYPDQRFDFFLWVYQHQGEFEDIVSHNLGLLQGESCRLGDAKEWKHGSFNVCIPVYIDNSRRYPGKRVLLRVPLPYKVGESTHQGNVEEKLRTEAATFIWIQNNCPDIPIPFLWGFGCPGGQSFMRLKNASFRARMKWHLRRIVSSLFGLPVPCSYICYPRNQTLEHGYMIMDYIEPTDAKMLSDSWPEFRHERILRTNLFEDLSRIIISLSQLPLPRIGSWTIDDRGILSLTNRPLLYQLHCLENEDVETSIPRSLTYTSTYTFYADLLACHDSRIYSQPNAILDEKDGLAQMANLFTMRGLLSHFTNRNLRHGPFVFSLTDLHTPNIFVDSNWRIKYIIDLEWACSLPIEMLAPPYWMTGRAVDELEDDNPQDFKEAYEQFTNIFEEEEKKFSPTHGSQTYRADIMRNNWDSGNFWYLHALQSLKGCYNLFRQHIQPIFNRNIEMDVFTQVMSCYWAADTQKVVREKLEAKSRYEQELQALFERGAREA